MMKKPAIVVLLLFLTLHHVAFAAPFRFSPRPNKAHLIHWREWGEEAFKEARLQGRLVLLSLSAVWCHWCHVMDETTYSDMAVIDYLNNHFVPIRVDANMRPDVDNLYNQGGWPSTVVLTPEGEVVQGGTYISPEDMRGWLETSVEMFDKGEEGFRETIGKGRKQTADRRQAEREAPGAHGIARITKMLESSYDKKYGGFGVSQKFPNPDAIDFLFWGYQGNKDPGVKTMIVATLQNMAKGEIYDSAEGGFFRYATAPDWSAPHYEKMLDLNAALMRNYATAYMVFGDSGYKKVLNGIISYVEKYLYDRRSGAFYGSQDADEAYYKKAERAGRKAPFVDRTIYSDSNAQMISALVASHGATGEEKYVSMARRTADFILQKLYSSTDGVYHYYSDGKHVEGLLSDNVLFGLALLDLYGATGERRYIDGAEEVSILLRNRFYDRASKGFRPALDRAAGPSVPATLWEYNGAVANCRTVIFLSRLYRHDRNEGLKAIIDEANAGLSATYERFEPSAALYGTALRWSVEEPLRITVIAGDDGGGRFLSQINRIYVPQKVVGVLSLQRERERIKELGYPLEEAVYVCLGKRCSPAFTMPEGLIKGIRRFIEAALISE